MDTRREEEREEETHSTWHVLVEWQSYNRSERQRGRKRKKKHAMIKDSGAVCRARGREKCHVLWQVDKICALREERDCRLYSCNRCSYWSRAKWKIFPSPVARVHSLARDVHLWAHWHTANAPSERVREGEELNLSFERENQSPEHQRCTDLGHAKWNQVHIALEYVCVSEETFLLLSTLRGERSFIGLMSRQ